MSTQTLTNTQLEAGLQAIHDLDLEMVKMKLSDKEEGRGWTKEESDEAENSYKQYLILCLKYPELSVVPTKRVDSFWHQHILDTRAYAKDCDRIFGYFLHHFPYLGMRGEEDALNLKRSFERTQELFKVEFGIEFSESSIDSSLCDSSACDNPPNCGSSCGTEGPGGDGEYGKLPNGSTSAVTQLAF